MRGGVSLTEIYDMPLNHINYINELIQDNIEFSKKVKQVVF
jgi:hypothetical protein